MSKATILKAATLFSSISLVLVFLLFQTGVFDFSKKQNYSIQTSPNGGAVTPIVKDTIPVDSVPTRLLSSSKVAILNDWKIPKEKRRKKKKGSDSAKKENSYLWTTKSGRIFETVLPEKDSLKSKADTAKTKGKQ